MTEKMLDRWKRMTSLGRLLCILQPELHRSRHLLKIYNSKLTILGRVKVSEANSEEITEESQISHYRRTKLKRKSWMSMGRKIHPVKPKNVMKCLQNYTHLRNEEIICNMNYRITSSQSRNSSQSIQGKYPKIPKRGTRDP